MTSLLAMFMVFLVVWRPWAPRPTPSRHTGSTVASVHAEQAQQDIETQLGRIMGALITAADQHPATLSRAQVIATPCSYRTGDYRMTASKGVQLSLGHVEAAASRFRDTISSTG